MHEAPQELQASLVVDYKRSEDPIGENRLLKPLSKLLVGNALNAEPTGRLGRECHESVANTGANTPNGKGKKTLK